MCKAELQLEINQIHNFEWFVAQCCYFKRAKTKVKSFYHMQHTPKEQDEQAVAHMGKKIPFTLLCCLISINACQISHIEFQNLFILSIQINLSLALSFCSFSFSVLCFVGHSVSIPALFKLMRSNFG